VSLKYRNVKRINQRTVSIKSLKQWFGKIKSGKYNWQTVFERNAVNRKDLAIYSMCKVSVTPRKNSTSNSVASTKI